YQIDSLVADAPDSLLRFLWPWKAQLSIRIAYGMTQIERGNAWFEYSMFFRDRFRTSFSIAFSEVATHNRFVLDRGGKGFNRTAPIIQLTQTAAEADCLGLLGLLNSSTAGFWQRQVCHGKGGGGIGGGIKTESWERFFAFNGTKVGGFPLASAPPLEL